MKAITSLLPTVLVLLCIGPTTLVAEGIPEPGQVIYGQIWNSEPWSGGQNVRLTFGNLTWTFQPVNGGMPVVITTPLTNINDQFCFALKVPMETLLGGSVVSSNTLILTNPPLVYARTNVALDGIPVFLKLPSRGMLTNSASNRGRYERIDLTLYRQDQDSNGNGLPDWWENLYFPGTGANPNDDPDKDGMSNLAEYLAGTNPNDRNSVFTFINITPLDGGGIHVEWSSLANRTYTLQRSSNLTTGFADLPSAIRLPTTPTTNTFDDLEAVAPGPYFYRLKVAY